MVANELQTTMQGEFMENVILHVSGLFLLALGLGFAAAKIVIHSLQWLSRSQNLLPLHFNFNRHAFPALGALLCIAFFAIFLKVSGFAAVLDGSAHTVYSILIVLLLTWNVDQGFRIAAEALSHRYDINIENNLSARRVYTQIQYLRRFVGVFVWVVGIGIGITMIEGAGEVGASLLASAGIASIVLGFAAQKSLGNLLSGIQIAFTQPLRIDDVVVVEHEWGKIEEINLTYIVVKLWDLRRLILPITYFTEKPFQNWTRTTAEMLAYIYLYTDYSVSIDGIRQQLTKVLSETDLWDGKVNLVQVTDTKNSVLEIRALFSARNAEKAWDLRCYVREKLITFLQQEYPGNFPKIRLESARKKVLEHIVPNNG
jgi:small-conductance mechanosensitive channel